MGRAPAVAQAQPARSSFQLQEVGEGPGLAFWWLSCVAPQLRCSTAVPPAAAHTQACAAHRSKQEDVARPHSCPGHPTPPPITPPPPHPNPNPPTPPAPVVSLDWLCRTPTTTPMGRRRKIELVSAWCSLPGLEAGNWLLPDLPPLRLPRTRQRLPHVWRPLNFACACMPLSPTRRQLCSFDSSSDWPVALMTRCRAGPARGSAHPAHGTFCRGTFMSDPLTVRLYSSSQTENHKDVCFALPPCLLTRCCDRSQQTGLGRTLAGCAFTLC